MSIRNLLIGGAVLATVVSGGIVTDIARAPDAEAACYGSVSTWKGKNVSCPLEARHFDAIKHSAYQYAPWATRGNFSEQRACWANVVSYGMLIA